MATGQDFQPPSYGWVNGFISYFNPTYGWVSVMDGLMGSYHKNYKLGGPFVPSPSACYSLAVLRHAPARLRSSNIAGWWCNNHLEKYEFVNGKDDIPYMKWKIKKHVPNHQPDSHG